MRCYLCGTEELDVLTTELRGGPGVVRGCRGCGLGMLEDGVERLDAYYDGEYRKQHGPRIDRCSDYQEIFDAYRHYQTQRVAFLKPWCTPESRLLEVGCATGHFLYHMKEVVGEVVGVDYDRGAAEFAGRMCHCTTYGCGLDETGMAPGSFDIVCAIQTMEHVDDPIEFARMLGRYVKPEGILYVEVPNLHDPLLAVYDNRSYRSFYFHRAHRYYFTQQSLLTVMNRAGFQGRVHYTQDYNFLNHLHWIMVGKPQTTCHDGLGRPTLPLTPGVESTLSQEIADWIQGVDRGYKAILARHGVTENLAFVSAVSSAH